MALNRHPKFVPIDEQPNHQIVHTLRLGKADRAAHQPLDPGSQIDVFAFDFLHMFLANRVLLYVHMPLVSTPTVIPSSKLAV